MLTCSRAKVLKAGPISSTVLTSTVAKLIPNFAAVASASPRCTMLKGLLGLARMPILVALGTRSRVSSSCFPVNPDRYCKVPVILVPGRASLFTNPMPTGSTMLTPTIGMLAVACFAARAAGEVALTITSGLSQTISSASNGSRARSPSA